jgi:hypothetical protein
MSDCYAFECPNEATTKLNAWGPGEVREFCDECADLRRDLSGYSTEVTDP